MVSKIRFSMWAKYGSFIWGAVSLASFQAVAASNNFGSVPGARTTIQAESPFSNYVAGVAVYVLMVGFLVAVLLIGGFLVLNLGLLSKRVEDRVGGRTPSDLGLLKNSVWPMEPVDKRVLPAEEEGYEVPSASDANHPAA